MRTTLQRLVSTGARAATPEWALAIVLTNQIALLSTAVTLSYEVYYLTDIGRYLPVFTANLVCIGAYLSGVALNRAGRAVAARTVTLGTVYVQLFVVSALISSGAGVHFFYFTAGMSLGMLFRSSQWVVPGALVLLATVLFLVCHFVFVPGATLIDVPASSLRVMLAASVVGTVFYSALFSWCFRVEISRAEHALAESHREMARLARIDQLTGVANRRTLDDHLAREWDRLRRIDGSLAIVLCDVDGFKAFNDRHGHLAGDVRIQQVASVLSGVVHRVTDLVARYGGEEFVIVLANTDRASAVAVAEQAREAVMEASGDGTAGTGRATISIGVACGGPLAVESPDALLHRADSAMYAAKRAGRNRVVTWEETTDAALVSV